MCVDGKGDSGWNQIVQVVLIDFLHKGSEKIAFVLFQIVLVIYNKLGVILDFGPFLK